MLTTYTIDRTWRRHNNSAPLFRHFFQPRNIHGSWIAVATSISIPRSAAKRSTEMVEKGQPSDRPRCEWKARRRVCLVVVWCCVRSFGIVLWDFVGFPECFWALSSGRTTARAATKFHEKDLSHTQLRVIAPLNFPFAISGRPLCSAPSVSSGLLSFPSAGAASVVGFAVCCILYAFSSSHPRSPPLLRFCSPSRGLLSLSSVAVAVVSSSARGVASGTAAAALLLRLLGEGALRC